MSNLSSQSSNLVAFVRVVESGTFSAAARNAGTTPSAISKNIARLEGELNTTLFRRSTRKLSLTPEGLAFYERVAPLLRALDESLEAVRPSATAGGHLRVSIPSDLGRLLLKRIYSVFLVEHPDIELDVTLLDHHVDLIGEGYDVVFRVGHLSDSNLKARTLAQMEMALVASPTFFDTHGRPDSVDALRHVPFVRYQLSGRTLPIVFDGGETLLPRGPIGVDSGFGLRTAAIDGMGVAYLMKCTVQQELDRGDLVQVLKDRRLPKLNLHAVHAFGASSPIRVQLFADFVRREVLSWQHPQWDGISAFDE